MVRKEYLVGDLKGSVQKNLAALKRAVGPKKMAPIAWSESQVHSVWKMNCARSFEPCPWSRPSMLLGESSEQVAQWRRERKAGLLKSRVEYRVPLAVFNVWKYLGQAKLSRKSTVIKYCIDKRQLVLLLANLLAVCFQSITARPRKKEPRWRHINWKELARVGKHVRSCDVLNV